MALLLDQVDIQSQVPKEVTRSLTLINELDEKVTRIQFKLKQLRIQYKQVLSQKTKQKIDQLYKKSVKLSQEKLGLSDKVNEIVDNAIQKLDNDLKQIEDDLKSNVTSDNKKRSLLLSKYQKQEKKRINQEIQQSQEMLLYAIQNEPLYCICQRPSLGSMIMCDNQSCSKEWFHLECVKLKEFPPLKDSWFCSSQCRKKGKGNIKK